MELFQCLEHTFAVRQRRKYQSLCRQSLPTPPSGEFYQRVYVRIGWLRRMHALVAGCTIWRDTITTESTQHVTLNNLVNTDYTVHYNVLVGDKIN